MKSKRIYDLPGFGRDELGVINRINEDVLRGERNVKTLSRRYHLPESETVMYVAEALRHGQSSERRY